MVFRYGYWGIVQESLYLIANVYVFFFLMGESIAPCAWAGVGLVVSPVERVKGQT